MRGGFRVHHQEEEEESAFVSMTDMTVSFLFIVMLLLAFFASQYNDKDTVSRSTYETVVTERNGALEQLEVLRQLLVEKDKEIAELKATTADLQKDISELKAKIAELEDIIAKSKKPDPLEAYLTRSAAERRRILETLRDQLKIDFPDLKVVISEESDALRFQGEGLFDRGVSTLKTDRKAVVEKIAARLQQILPCYTIGPLSTWNEQCNPGASIIEALQIEGHTDSDGNPESNLMLSTARANSTFTTMTASEPRLVDFQNFRKQPVLSVAGYGQMRPIRPNETLEGKATNRRVDLRIIMYSPSRSAEIERIRHSLEKYEEPSNGPP
ncbi:OmpA family protein [Rhizobium leguminosarum]|uniref:OmpA family protein n=1 Tax=Rhizobium leguminosarum TaxID=384 RepID=UPI001C9868C3|nr:OmpA family protein [Rhizobium leguminosarum]MBY5361193.1 OmpA family protein [Rhizobium leguminosarum]MBY5400270.1 OmpA family protein [Rhizobium leguminosarum]